MTLNELIAWAEETGVTGNEQLAVRAFGGFGRSGKGIKSATIGFDWDSGSILLTPDLPLELYRSPKQRREDEKRRREFLDENATQKAPQR
jgi:hypothetical protein